jgi:hypothetical protein
MECASSLTLCFAADLRLQRLLAYSCGTCGSVPLRSATHCFWAVLGVVLCVLKLAVLPSAYVWPGCGLVALWGTVSAVCMTARPLRAAAVVPSGDCAGALTCTCLFSGSATVLLALARCSGKVAVPLLSCSGFSILITLLDVSLHLVSFSCSVCRNACGPVWTHVGHSSRVCGVPASEQGQQQLHAVLRQHSMWCHTACGLRG